jgi:two-component system, OmpR family, sensor histidine kinase ArlS
MNLKKRFSLFFSVLFSLLLASVMLLIYYLFANFRQQEFRTRLIQRAETTVRFLLTVKEIDHHLLEVFDRNRANKLFNEKTSVYDENLRRIYTSNKSYQFQWTQKDFRRLERYKLISKHSKGDEVVAILFTHNNKNYYVITSARDVYEDTNMRYLKFLLLGAFLLGTFSVFILSFYLSRKSLKPLDQMRVEIQNITDKDLQKRLPLLGNHDEIDELSQSFNQMMDRIDVAYQRQKEFTGNASHELRTPLTRITAQLQNLIHAPGLAPSLKKSLDDVSRDTYQLSDIISSLLLLAEIEDLKSLKSQEAIRLDELIFEIVNELSRIYPDLKFQFEIENNSDRDVNLEIPGDERLLKIAFSNLVKNAYIYSDDKLVSCFLDCGVESINIILTNTGPVPVVNDTAVLFNTFVRGINTQGKAGSGVGLSIVKRILQYHNATINYLIAGQDTSKIIISFPVIETSA